MIELNNISKTYNIGTPNQEKIFEHFNLEIPTGEFLSIIGSNGSGKTSLLNLICGSVIPESGSIKLIEDRKDETEIVDITHFPEHKRYVKIGRVLQDPAAGTCPSMTLRENLALADNKNKPWNLGYAVNKKKEKIYQEKLSYLGFGLENKLDTLVGSFSGGERQAIALLMATLTPIDYLILDEHTAALDPKSSELIMNLTEQIIEELDVTVIMITHNLKYALKYGNRLIMMHKGRILLDKKGQAKQELELEKLLDQFFEISIEVGNTV